MPVIRISDYVMDILKKYAIPLEDNADSVLRRIIEEYDSVKEKYTFVPPSANIPRNKLVTSEPKSVEGYPRPYAERYARWIIPSLTSLGSRADAQTVINHIQKTYGHELTERDREALPSGELRWVKNVNWARYDLVKGGLLNENAPYGIWQLTEKGRAYLGNSAPTSLATKGERPMINRTNLELGRMCRGAFKRQLEPSWGQLNLHGIWLLAADGKILSLYSNKYKDQDKWFYGVIPGDWKRWDNKCHLALLMRDGFNCSFGLLTPEESKLLLDRISLAKDGSKKINVRLPSTGRIYIQEWPDFPFADRVVEMEDEIKGDDLRSGPQNLDQATLEVLNKMLGPSGDLPPSNYTKS